jgi:hypothetical protein
MNIWRVQQVLYKTLKDYFDQYGIDMPIYANLPQVATYPYLKIGSIKFKNGASFTQDMYDFNVEMNIVSLKQTNQELCSSLEKIYSNFADFIKKYDLSDDNISITYAVINEGAISENLSESALIGSLHLTMSIIFNA